MASPDKTPPRANFRDLTDANDEIDVLRDRVRELTEALGDSLEWLTDARRLIAELADDLKGSYEPEKGWPPHIEAAANIDGDLEQMIADGRAVLNTEEPQRG